MLGRPFSHGPTEATEVEAAGLTGSYRETDNEVNERALLVSRAATGSDMSRIHC
ncbi:MAG: hypothetical protein JWQ93_1848, partial [Marmoricola sp.]|nr:hypothetical protein [Marmoricola sp.]